MDRTLGKVRRLGTWWVTVQPIHIGWAGVGAWPVKYQWAVGKGAKESSLFCINLCLSRWILLKRPFYSGDWVKKMGDQKWCVLKRSCHDKWTCSAWDFSKGGSPTLQNTFFWTSLCKKMHRRWKSAPGKPQQCARAPPSFPRSADELFTLTWQLTSLWVTSSVMKHISSTSERCFGYLVMSETRKGWNLEGPTCCIRPAGQDWHWSVTEVGLWPLTWKYKAKFSPHFPPPESSLVPYMAVLYYDPFK